MSRDAMKSLPGDALVKKYHDKNGKPRRVGIPDKLKASQCLSCIFQESKNWICIHAVESCVVCWNLGCRAYTACFADLIARVTREPLKETLCQLN